MRAPKAAERAATSISNGRMNMSNRTPIKTAAPDVEINDVEECVYVNVPRSKATKQLYRLANDTAGNLGYEIKWRAAS